MTLQSEERKAIIDYRIEKAKRTYEEAVSNYNSGHFTLVANRLYYTLFYAVTALLLQNKINSTTHQGAKSMLHYHLVKEVILSKEDGNLFNRMLQMRNTGDYDDFFDYTEEDVASLMQPVEVLMNKIIGLINKGE